MIAGNLHLISSLYLPRANLRPFVLSPAQLHRVSKSFSSPARTPRYIYRAIVSTPAFVLRPRQPSSFSHLLQVWLLFPSHIPASPFQHLFHSNSFSCLWETRREHSFPDDYLLTALIVPCRHGNALLQSQRCISLAHTTAQSCSKKS